MLQIGFDIYIYFIVSKIKELSVPVTHRYTVEVLHFYSTVLCALPNFMFVCLNRKPCARRANGHILQEGNEYSIVRS